MKAHVCHQSYHRQWYKVQGDSNQVRNVCAEAKRRLLMTRVTQASSSSREQVQGLGGCRAPGSPNAAVPVACVFQGNVVMGNHRPV